LTSAACASSSAPSPSCRPGSGRRSASCSSTSPPHATGGEQRDGREPDRSDRRRHQQIGVATEAVPVDEHAADVVHAGGERVRPQHQVAGRELGRREQREQHEQAERAGLV
jgi:hypothetical protein